MKATVRQHFGKVSGEMAVKEYLVLPRKLIPEVM